MNEGPRDWFAGGAGEMPPFASWLEQHLPPSWHLL